LIKIFNIDFSFIAMFIKKACGFTKYQDENTPIKYIFFVTGDEKVSGMSPKLW
jgi:hypothetical protein